MFFYSAQLFLQEKIYLLVAWGQKIFLNIYKVIWQVM